MAPAGSEEAGLDAQELQHLALKAMNEDRAEDALRLLKRAVAQQPDNGWLYYLLGALHAELGMIERSVEEMTRATQLSPELGIARFQLGLMHMARGDVAKAQDVWVPLDQLDEHDALRVFKQGMVHFLHGQDEDAIALLKRGIALNQAGEALSRSMQRVIEQIQAEVAGQEAAPAAASMASQPSPKADPGEEKQSVSAELQHVLLANYRK